jgi:hypothetical protein
VHQLFVEVRERSGYGRVYKFLWWAVAQEWVAEGASPWSGVPFQLAARESIPLHCQGHNKSIARKAVDVHELFVEVRRRDGYAYGRVDKFL